MNTWTTTIVHLVLMSMRKGENSLIANYLYLLGGGSTMTDRAMHCPVVLFLEVKALKPFASYNTEQSISILSSSIFPPPSLFFFFNIFSSASLHVTWFIQILYPRSSIPLGPFYVLHWKNAAAGHSIWSELVDNCSTGRWLDTEKSHLRRLVPFRMTASNHFDMSIWRELL